MIAMTTPSSVSVNADCLSRSIILRSLRAAAPRRPDLFVLPPIASGGSSVSVVIRVDDGDLLALGVARREVESCVFGHRLPHDQRLDLHALGGRCALGGLHIRFLDDPFDR